MNYKHPCVHSSVIYNHQDLETAQVPVRDEQIKKLWYVYTMTYYVAVKKKEFLSFATAWMELETIMLNEISRAMKDKHHMISLITGI